MKNSFKENKIHRQVNESPDAFETSPGPLYATSGSLSGEIFLQWDSVNNASKYIIEMSKMNSAKWQQLDIIKDPLYCVTGLKPGYKYAFRVAAVYTEGTGPWSIEVTKKAK